ncbi:MAG TPA: ATP-dependent DNA helicase RecQ [Thermoanaerobaculia bacterium]|jgi:ATP-dependent DNA helicase RecQ|nr:ATP-dependent DNA helicase RecQ [Thermoanaerobaculia bacterium]
MVETIGISTLRKTLRRTFGFRSLREGQEEVIRSVVEGRDTLAIMPTGAGKSLCYQLPGKELPGTTVVVSPLLSLMKDQVDKLRELGIDAAQVNSTLSSSEEAEVLEEIRKEQREFVFVTPERLAQPGFLETLRSNKIDVFVIDEAHCISQWGHDFRPSYLQIRTAVEALGNPPVLALTATATPEVVEDILRQLGREGMQVISTGTYRENLRLEVIRAAGEEAKLSHLAKLLSEIEGTGIVYTSTVKDCEAVTEYLQGLGFEVARYHGRLGARERHRNQDRFMAGELKAVVATNAFGMGIDKPDIRFVIHYSMPGTLEAYYQEAGRAGRDGEPARCVMLFQPEDRNTHIFFLNGRYPKREHFEAVYRALERLKADREPVAVSEVHGRSKDVAQAKVRVVLATMRDLGLVEEAEGGLFRLLLSGLDPEELAEMAARYEQKAEADRDNLRRVVLYAQTALCRWKAVLDYFGETPEWERCDHCDNCERPIAEPPPAPVVKREALPMPPILGDKDPGSLQPGDTLTLPIFGTGEVREVAGEYLTVAFSDGEVREFRR